MFQRLKNWFKRKQIIQDEIIVAPAPTHQVDERDIATRKRVKKAFEAQKQQMQSRAMKAHDPSCGDVQLCKKRKCFKWEPDKIVSDPKEVKRGDAL